MSYHLSLDLNYNCHTHSKRALALFLKFAVVICILSSLGTEAAAQVQPPDRDYLFLQDKLKKTEAKKRKKELAQKRAQASSSKITKDGNLPFDITASTIDFDTSGSVLTAAGNVIISYSTLIAESSEAKVNTVTNVAHLKKDIRISDINANLTAQSAEVNLATGESKLEDA